MLRAYARLIPLFLFALAASLAVYLFMQLSAMQRQAAVAASPAEGQGICYHIYGYNECPWFKRARCVAKEFQQTNPSVSVAGEGADFEGCALTRCRSPESAVADAAEDA